MNATQPLTAQNPASHAIDGQWEVVKGFLQRRQASEAVKATCRLLLENTRASGSTTMSMRSLQASGIDLQASDPQVSPDGHSGVLVAHQSQVGFRRHWNQESAIVRDFFAQPDPHEHFIPTGASQNPALLDAMAASLPQVRISDSHKQALKTLEQGRHLLISGGPGTGKTTALTYLLLFILAHHPGASIGLCAPTGKAAQRMSESLAQGLSNIHWQALEQTGQGSKPSISDALKNVSGQTIHRLLGYRPEHNQLRYHAKKPAPYDVLIVDEASMLDLSLMQAIMTALKPGAELILLGDANQLPPVGCGAPFADLCHLAQMSGSEQWIQLDTNYRFAPQSGIATAARAALDNDAETLLAVSHVNKPSSGGFSFIPAQTASERKAALAHWLKTIPAEMIANQQFKVLCATNHGPGGVLEANAMVAEILGKKTGPDPLHNPHEGLPIMVLSNDYYRQVFNGDIGIVHWRDGQWMVKFDRQEAGLPRWLPLNALRHWQSAYAITIHKSQGSEYPWVLALIEDAQNTELADAKLLYTAITRASHHFTLVSSPGVIKQVLTRNGRRNTFMRSMAASGQSST